MNPADTLKLTKRDAAAIAKYAGLVGLTPEKNSGIPCAGRWLTPGGKA